VRTVLSFVVVSARMDRPGRRRQQQCGAENV